MNTPASPVVRHITTASVVVVASIAAVVSYSHMQQLADHAGETWRAWLIPISIDGLVVAASMVLLARRRAGVPGGVLAWSALAAGVLASLAANMADARHEVTAVLIAGWPAAAFAVALELLLQQRRAERPVAADSPDRTGSAVPTQPARPVPPIPAARPLQPPSGVVGGSPRTSSAPGLFSSVRSGQQLDSAPHPGALTLDTGIARQGGASTEDNNGEVAGVVMPTVASASPPAASRQAPPVHQPPARQHQPSPTSPAPAANRQPTPAPAGDLVDRVRPLVTKGLGRQTIATQLGITQHQARQAIDQVKAEQRPALRLAATTTA
jgi:Protein of unknown function (DUF2637)